jgi:SAM-dependent methyltransferase
VPVNKHPGHPYFAAVGDRLGRNYLRYAFTKGTDQEVAFLLELLDLPSDARVLDVGCGAGRHAVAFAKAGLSVTGVDVSERLLQIAAEAAREAGVAASFYEVDARQMPFDDEFDAVVSICQGGFGLMGDDDSVVLKRMAEAVKPSRRVVVTAFSALYEAMLRRPEARFDVDSGVVHEKSTIQSEDDSEEEVDLWTSVYTPRELRLMAIGVGLVPEEVYSVDPGDFARRPPDLEHAEFLLAARRP